MQPVEMIIGVILVIIACICFVAAFYEDGSVIALGAAVLLGAVGGFGFYHGLHGEHVKFKRKHLAIMHDLAAQGIPTHYDRVYAVGGHKNYGTEVDLYRGKCLFAFNATKIKGTWYVTLPTRRTTQHVLDAAALNKLATAC